MPLIYLKKATSCECLPEIAEPGHSFCSRSAKSTTRFFDAISNLEADSKKSLAWGNMRMELRRNPEYMDGDMEV